MKMQNETEEQYRAREEARKRDEDRRKRDEADEETRKQQFRDAALIMLAAGIL